MSSRALVQPVPIATPMYSETGAMSQVWVNFFEAIRRLRIAPSSGSGALLHEETLTADATVNGPGAPSTDGDLLIVTVTQDATGGWVITWGTDFAAGIPANVSLKGDSITTFSFFGWGGVWWPSAPAIFSEP